MNLAVQRIEKLALVLTGAATLLSLIFTRELSWVLGVAVGGLLGVVNFYALRRLVAGLVGAADASSRRQGIMVLLLTLKFAALAAAIYLVLRFLPINGVALLLGVSVVVISIFVEGFRTMMCGAEQT